MIRVLVVQFWTRELEPIRTALRAHGSDVHITRVDIEPALNAALHRERFDLVIIDPELVALARDAIAACLREHHCTAPVVIAEDIESLPVRIDTALRARRS